MPPSPTSFLRSALPAFLALALLLPEAACKQEAPGVWRSGWPDGLGIGSADPAPLGTAEMGNDTLALARAVVTTGAPGSAKSKRLSGYEGRRVFLTAYGPVHPPVSTTGMGKDLGASVEAAAAALRGHSRLAKGAAAEAVRDGDLRLKIEIPTRGEKKKLKETDGIFRPKRESLGVVGWYVEGDGTPGWLTGSEVAERDLYLGKEKGLKGSAVRKILEDRAGEDGLKADQTVIQFEAESWIDAAERGAPPVRLYRARPHPDSAPPVTADLLLESSIRAADYIERIIGPDGKQVYLYHTVEDRMSGSYNQLRHAGTAFSLLQAYDRTRWPRYRAAAERTLEFVQRSMKWEKKAVAGGDEIAFVLDYDDAKLGGAGLALIAFSHYTEATGDRRYWRDMQALARFITTMQRPNGRMNSFYAHEPGMKVSDEENEFYPGEALLGLMRLHAIEPNPKWLEVARKAADYMILERDRGKGEDKVPHDHWLLYGLSYLYHFTQEPRYLAHAELICRAMQRKARGPDHADVKNWPDLLGGFYNPPQVAPGATKVEGIGAAIDLLKEAGKDTQWLMDIVVPSSGWLMRHQFSPTSAWFAKVPEKVWGGFPENPLSNEIRNDYVQHTLSGLLATERHLRAKEGVVLPGGPAWSDAVKAGKATFAGIPERSPSPGLAMTPPADAPKRNANPSATAEREVQPGGKATKP